MFFARLCGLLAAYAAIRALSSTSPASEKCAFTAHGWLVTQEPSPAEKFLVASVADGEQKESAAEVECAEIMWAIKNQMVAMGELLMLATG